MGRSSGKKRKREPSLRDGSRVSKSRGKKRKKKKVSLGSGDSKTRDGFRYGAATYHDRIKTVADENVLRYKDPSSQSDLSKDGAMAYFELEAGENQWIRLADQPVLLEYSVLLDNPAYEPGSTDATKKLKVFSATTGAQETLHLNPLPGASCFIDNAIVSLNGTVVTGNVEMQGHSHIYKALNQKISLVDDRRRDGVVDFLNRQEDREADASASRAYVLSQTSCLKTLNTDRTPFMAQVSLDGYVLLCRPKANVLSNLDRSASNDMMYLPPKTRLTVQLNFRSDLGRMLDWGGVADSYYFENKKPAAFAEKKVRVEMRRVRLAYETFVPRTSKMTRELEDGSLRYAYDVPHVNTVHLATGTTHTDSEVRLPPGSLYLFVCMMPGHALWSSAASLRTMRADFAFPETLVNLTMTLGNRFNLLAPQLGDLSGEGAYSNPVLRQFFSSLRRSGVIDDDFTSVYPPTGRSYSQILCCDLRQFRLRETTSLNVAAEYGGTSGSPKDWFLVTCALTQCELLKNSKGDWSTSDVLP